MAFALAVTLLAVIAGLVILLSVPVDVRISVDCRHTWSGHATVRWLLGLMRVSKSIPSASNNDKRPAPKPAKRRRRKKRRKKRKITWRRIHAAVSSPGFAGRGARFALDAAKALRVRSARGSARIGLDDPADTGLLWSVLGPLHAGIATLPVVQVHVEPEFQEPTFVAEGSANIRVIPVRLIVAAIAFFISPVTLRAVWAAVRQ